MDLPVEACLSLRVQGFYGDLVTWVYFATQPPMANKTRDPNNESR